jgi:membrane protease YdiL (CAAX protease family)
MMGNEGSIGFALITFLITLLIAGVLHGLAYSSNFLTLNDRPKSLGLKSITAVCFVFVFLLLSKTLPSILFGILQSHYLFLSKLIGESTLLIASYTISSCLTLAMLLFIAQVQDKQGLNAVIGFHKENILKDIKQGIFTFFLSIFVVTAAGILVQLLTYFIFNENGNEQQIITYLRENAQILTIKILGLINIVLIAPALEELVFRGGIQKTLRRTFSPRISIVITSIIFALVHFSTEQGLGNIALLISIFILSCYLGFIYEKRQTLVAPFIVHMLFNLDGVIRIFLGTS